jgi:predicted transcriptional regulator
MSFRDLSLYYFRSLANTIVFFLELTIIALHLTTLYLIMSTHAHTNQLQPFSIRIRKDQKIRLSAIAEARDRTAHALAIKALDEFIEKEEARLGYERQAISAYENLQATGLHVTADELKAWAKSLNTAEPKQMPICHG